MDKMTMLELPQLITTRQAAELLGVHPRTVARMCEDGQLVAVKIRTVWRVNRDALLQMCGLGDGR